MDQIVIGGARARLVRPLPPPPAAGPARVVALTGGIGSSKSTAAREMERRGAVLADADALAREVVAPGTPVLARIRERFGEDVVGADGALDRAALAARVFA